MVLDFTYPKEVKKLLSEVKLLSQLSHPHIVRYYQAWADNIPEDEL
jgi:serine/threonine protein kinase